MRVGEKPGWNGLNNSVVFTWAFVEMLVWFWVSLKTYFITRPTPLTTDTQIFTTLRDERQVLATQIQERRNTENNLL